MTGKSWYDDTFGHRATAPNDDGRELLFESDRVRGTTIGAARAFVIDKRGALSPDVSDVAPASDGKCLGTGFVELTGYATPVELATIVVRR